MQPKAAPPKDPARKSFNLQTQSMLQGKNCIVELTLAAHPIEVKFDPKDNAIIKYDPKHFSAFSSDHHLFTAIVGKLKSKLKPLKMLRIAFAEAYRHDEITKTVIPIKLLFIPLNKEGSRKKLTSGSLMISSTAYVFQFVKNPIGTSVASFQAEVSETSIHVVNYEADEQPQVDLDYVKELEEQLAELRLEVQEKEDQLEVKDRIIKTQTRRVSFLEDQLEGIEKMAASARKLSHDDRLFR